MSRFILLFIFWLSILSVAAQELTIDQCQSAARQNYPMLRQLDIIQGLHDFTIANVHTGRYPQVIISGQASYQSAVTRVPIDLPNMSIQPLAKDQYRAVADISQTIFDGGSIRKTVELQDLSTAAERQQVEVELSKVRERVNQIFFGVLLSDKQQAQALLIRKDLENALTKTRAAIDNGVALKMSADLLQAELLRADQRLIEIRSMRKSYVEMLSLITGTAYESTVVLQEPVFQPVSSTDILRPEMKLFEQQRSLTRGQYDLAMTRNNPRGSFFLQTGYGRPGLNMLQNRFDTWYIGGLRFSWNLSGKYNVNRDRQIMDLNLRLVDVRQDIFLLNTRISIRQQEEEIRRLDELIRIDEQLVEVRSRIRTTAKAQLDNGVITTNDFLREFNAEDQARQNLFLHRVQLSLANHNYRVTLGQP